PDFHIMVVMARFGRVARVVSSLTPFDDEFRTQALADCNADFMQTHPLLDPDDFQIHCFIYSEDLNVVVTEDEYGRASHYWHPDNRAQQQN
ncbi:MAG: hypothetical protein AAF202_09790, partial [Pseudomonadota bacterium]